jgi:Zn-dependent peptidase ImmA (M78 family)
VSRKLSEPVREARKLLADQNITTYPVPVEKIAKSLGADLRFSPLHEDLSGMIYIKDGVPIIGVNSLHHPNRQRYTIAHECGHLMLHKTMITSSVHVDKNFPVLMRDNVSAQGVIDIEIQANQFAAELLMPAEMLIKALSDTPADIDSDAPIEALARKFKVSKQALEYRIRNLQNDK